jgi:hypothetical protein
MDGSCGNPADVADGRRRGRTAPPRMLQYSATVHWVHRHQLPAALLMPFENVQHPIYGQHQQTTQRERHLHHSTIPVSCYRRPARRVLTVSRCSLRAAAGGIGARTTFGRHDDRPRATRRVVYSGGRRMPHGWGRPTRSRDALIARTQPLRATLSRCQHFRCPRYTTVSSPHRHRNGRPLHCTAAVWRARPMGYGQQWTVGENGHCIASSSPHHHERLVSHRVGCVAGVAPGRGC